MARAFPAAIEALRRRPAALAMAIVAGSGLVWLGLGLATGPVPERLAEGFAKDLRLEPDGYLDFEAPLRFGDQLFLVVEQRGLDVEVGEIDGRDRPPVDLPLGARVTEELRLYADRNQALKVRVRALEGRGTPRLIVKRLGPASVADLPPIRDFERLRVCLAGESPACRVGLADLAIHATEERQRFIAALVLAIAEPAVAEITLTALGPAPNPALEVQALFHLSRTLIHFRRYQEARPSLLKTVEAAHRTGDLQYQALAEHELAYLAWQDNDLAGIIRHNEAARQLYQAAGYLKAALQVEFNLARGLTRRGGSAESLAILLRQLATFEPAGSAIGRGDLLREIGWWLLMANNAREARALLVAAQAQSTGGPGSLQRLALAELELANFDEARHLLKMALDRDKNLEEQAAVELTLCQVEISAKQLAEARRYCTGALQKLEASGIAGARPSYEMALARLEQKEGHLENAERLATMACDRQELQRRSAGDELERMDFVANRASCEEILVDLRMALHRQNPGRRYDLQALEAGEGHRARSLRDLLSSEQVKADSRPDASRRSREQELRQILDIQTRGPLQRLLVDGHLDKADVQGLENPRRELADLRLSSLPDSDAEEPSPKVTSFELESLQRELEPGAILLAFHLGRDQAFGWAIDQNQARGVALGPSQPIRLLADALHQQLGGHQTWRNEAILTNWLGELAHLLYSPFEKELRSARQVVVVASAELQMVPFGAMPFPAGSGQPLIADRALAFLPSAAILPELRRRQRSRRTASRLLAIIDDPVYDNDSRLPPTARRPGPFPPLPGTAREGEDLAAMVAYFPAPSRRLTGFAANRETLLGGALSDYRVLHFAAHARTQGPPRGLILSRFDAAGSRIEDIFGLQELYSLSLDADLAVVSACSSGLGEAIAGEGLVGLSHGFFQAGVPRLLLTLWPVGDDSTRQLIDLFYRHLLLGGKSPTEALRLTQKELHSAQVPIKDWAAFELFGEWRPIADFSPDRSTATGRFGSYRTTGRPARNLQREEQTMTSSKKDPGDGSRDRVRSSVPGNNPTETKPPGDRAFTSRSSSEGHNPPINKDSADRGFSSEGENPFEDR